MDLRIGILACDHVDADQQAHYGDYPEMFENLMLAQDNTLEFSVYDLIAEQFPVDLHACDAYIITGSRLGVYEFESHDWISKAETLVERLYAAKIPTVGICFGHQLIAAALGGKVEKAENKEHALGVQRWQITQQRPWMGESNMAQLALNASHQDQVMSLPPQAERFASSDFCPIAAFEIGSMLAFQGHPEFNSDYTRYLYEKHQARLTPKTQQATQDSFAHAPDSNTVGGWMLTFIQQQLAA